MTLDLSVTLAWLIHYRYLVLLPIAVLEGPIITVIAAFLASQGYFNIFVVYAVVVGSDLIGDMLFYGIGRFGGHWVGFTPERRLKMETHFTTHGGKTLLFGKLTHSAGWAILMAAGIAKVPIGEFLWFNLLGTLPKSLFLLLVGYYLGAAYQNINSYIDKIGIILFILLGAGGVWYLLKKKYGRISAL